MIIRNQSKNLFFLLIVTLSVIALAFFSKNAYAEDVPMKNVKLIISKVKEEKSEEGLFYVRATVLNEKEAGFQPKLSLTYFFKFTKEELDIFMPSNGKVLETFKQELTVDVKVPIDSILFKGDVNEYIESNENALNNKNAFIFNVSSYSLYVPTYDSIGMKDGDIGIDLNAALGSMRILEDNNEYYMYDFTEATDTETNNPLGIDRIVFQNRRVMNDKHPHGENLVGKRIRAWGVISTSDKKTIEVRKWIVLDQLEEPSNTETFGPEKTIYGYFQNTNGTELDLNNKKANHYQFFDFNGKRYDIIIPSDSKFRRVDTQKPYKITGTISGGSRDFEIILLKEAEELNSDFQYKDSEIVNFNGTIEELLTISDTNQNESSARVTYQFDYQGKKYVAVFDTSFLGKDKATEISKLSGNISISGIVSTAANVRYVTVLSYTYLSESTKEDLTNAGKFDKEGQVKQKTFKGNILTYKETITVGKDKYQVFSFLTDGGYSINIAAKESLSLGLYSGGTVSVNTTYNSDLYKLGVFIASSITKVEDIQTKQRGTVVSIVESGSTSCTVNFKTVFGSTVKTVLPVSEETKNSNCDKLVGQYLEVFGKESITSEFGQVLMITYYTVLTKENGVLEIEGEKSVTFNGYIRKVIKTTNKSIIVKATNQYGYEETLELDATYVNKLLSVLKADISYLYKTEMSFTGYRTSTGIIFVMDFGFIEVPKEYPAAIDYKFDILEYFPNMNHWEGVLNISDLGGQANQLQLITKRDKFILYADLDTRSLIEASMKKTVCLRGEYREGGSPYWSGQIVVYDFKLGPCDAKAEPENIPQLRPDPQKEAHYTYQYHADPKDFIYGNAILEALYFPEVIESKDSPPPDIWTK